MQVLRCAGGYCAGGVAPAVAAAGYFPSAVEPYLFYPCAVSIALACVGGGGGNTSRLMRASPDLVGNNVQEPNYCAQGNNVRRSYLKRRSVVSMDCTTNSHCNLVYAGYTGFLCSSCLQGYTAYYGSCLPCPPDSTGAFQFLFVLVPVLLGLSVWWKSTSLFHFSASTLTVEFVQSSALFLTYSLTYSTTLQSMMSYFSIFDFNIDFMATDCAFPNNRSYFDRLTLTLLLPVLVGVVTLAMFYLWRRVSGPSGAILPITSATGGPCEVTKTHNQLEKQLTNTELARHTSTLRSCTATEGAWSPGSPQLTCHRALSPSPAASPAGSPMIAAASYNRRTAGADASPDVTTTRTFTASNGSSGKRAAVMNMKWEEIKNHHRRSPANSNHGSPAVSKAGAHNRKLSNTSTHSADSSNNGDIPVMEVPVVAPSSPTAAASSPMPLAANAYTASAPVSPAMVRARIESQKNLSTVQQSSPSVAQEDRNISTALAPNSTLQRSKQWGKKQINRLQTWLPVFDEDSSDRMVDSFLLFLALIHIPMCHTVLEYFHCIPSPDGDYLVGLEVPSVVPYFQMLLRFPSNSSSTTLLHCGSAVAQYADPTVQCYVGSHITYMPLAVLGLLVYVIGIPLLFGVLLYRTRHAHTQRKVRCRYGSLFLPYK